MSILNRAGFLFGLCCILALAACGPGAATGGQTWNTSPTATVTPHPTVQPASTTGWAIFTDKRFHFQIPIPPGWKAKAYTTAWECPQGGDGDYIVGFFPPNIYPDAPGAIPADFPFGKIHEYMDIYLPLCATSGEATPNPHWTPEPSGILIDGVQAVHVQAVHVVADNSDWTQRWAIASFGGQQYKFALNVTPQEKGQVDLPLYYGMLASFRYLG